MRFLLPPFLFLPDITGCCMIKRMGYVLKFMPTNLQNGYELFSKRMRPFLGKVVSYGETGGEIWKERQRLELT